MSPSHTPTPTHSTTNPLHNLSEGWCSCTGEGVFGGMRTNTQLGKRALTSRAVADVESYDELQAKRLTGERMLPKSVRDTCLKIAKEQRNNDLVKFKVRDHLASCS